MALHDRDRFDQQVEAGAQEVHVEQLGIVVGLDEDPLVVVDCVAGLELDCHSLVGAGWDCASGVPAAENVALLAVELVGGRQIHVVVDRQQPGCLASQLDLPKVHTDLRQSNTEPLPLPRALKLALIAAHALDHKPAQTGQSNHSWHVPDLQQH
jgi:hypothetical protein